MSSVANTTEAPSYRYSFKLVSGYSVINIPNNVIIPNLKNITIRKLSYNFNQSNQYVAKLSIMGYDTHIYTEGQITGSYTLSFFSPSGTINSQINYVNYANQPDVQLSYGNPMSQFTLIFDTDYSTIQGSLGQMSTGGSAYVTQENPVLIEIDFQ